MERNQILKMHIFFVATSLFCIGCQSSSPKKSGFLDDYTSLEPDGADRLAYMDKAALANYTTFIIDPIKTHFHHESSARKSQAKGELKPEDIDDIKNYMHETLEDEIRKGGFKIAYRPADGVARVRIAITDLKKSTPALNVIPHTKLTGLGLGAAAMEAELIDSKTGKQLAAVVQSQKGSALSLAGLKDWGDAKDVIDNWAKRFVKKLNEAHGR